MMAKTFGRWTSLRALGSRLSELWFTPMPAARLAGIRIILGAFTTYVLITRYSAYVQIARSPSDLFAPLGIIDVLALAQPLDPAAYALCHQLAIVSGIFATAGFAYRVTGPAFGLLLLFVFTYRNSWGMNYHNFNLAVLDAGILALAPAHHAWSCDAWLGRRWSALRRWWIGDMPVPAWDHAHWRYGWPVRLLCMSTALTYFVAGVAKLVGGGWAWISGENLRDQVAYNALAYELIGTGASGAAWTLYNATTLFAGLALFSLVIELGAPLVALHRPMGRIWALAAFGMHWGIRFVMGIYFPMQLYGVAFAPFFDVERLKIARRPSSS